MKNDDHNIVVKTTILCDDIRREDNGKDILIGVYSAGIVVPAFPVNLIVAIWMMYEADKLGETKGKFRVIGPKDVTLMTADVEISVKRVGPAAMAIRGIPMQFQAPGEIKFQFQQSNESWREVGHTSVAQGPVPGFPVASPRIPSAVP